MANANVIINNPEDTILFEIKAFLEEYKSSLNLTSKNVKIDCKFLLDHTPSLYDKLLDNPEELISLFKKALEEKYSLKDISIMLFGLNNPEEINNIRVINLDKLYNLRGVIKRLTNVFSRDISIKYECPSCGSFISIAQTKKKKQEPRKCSCGRKGSFIKVSKETKDVQELNLEELPEEIDGRQPKQLRVYLEGDLTDPDFSRRLQPGKKVEIIGIIKTLPTFMTRKDEELNLSEFMLEANNLISLEEEDDVNLSEEDIREIKEIAACDPLETLSLNVAPEIYGYQKIKKALVLQMVKGTPIKKSEGQISREDINVLLVGDPGTSKSTLLKSVQMRCPRSKMVVGTKSSKVGLTAAVKKDELSGEFSLEAGAMVLCSGSLLCLDELDKMGEEQFAELLEPMSMSIITVNKAGISATLPSKTSVLASANPEFGSFFNSEKPVAKQIKIPSPLLNRFDLIFIMKDVPNTKTDQEAINHIFEGYCKGNQATLSIDQFKKYITYCKKLNPTINPNLTKKFSDFYIKIRGMSVGNGAVGLPINLRNLEGLIRLSQASAKLRLKTEVEEKDFEIAKEIFEYSLSQIGYDPETGVFDNSIRTERVITSKRGKLEKIIFSLQSLSKRLGKHLPKEEIIKDISFLNLTNEEYDSLLDDLQEQGQIFSPKKGYYQLI